MLAGAYRALKPGGELYFADVYADRRERGRGDWELLLAHSFPEKAYLYRPGCLRAECRPESLGFQYARVLDCAVDSVG